MRKRKQSKKSNLKTDYSIIPRGSEYKPFLVIQNIPSVGRSSRIFGHKTGRQHELLSDLERDFFLIFEFAEEVIDIREQFPLNLEETLLISEELGIIHPKDPKTKDYITMTSDFCVTIKEGSSAIDIIRSLKYKDELLNKRTIEKLAIEKEYWERKDLNWAIVTEEEVNKDYSINVSDVLGYYNIEEITPFNEFDNDTKEDMILEFIKRLIDSEKTTREIISLFTKDSHLNLSDGISLFKHLIARKYIKIDLTKPLELEKNNRVDLLKKAKDLGEDYYDNC